MHSAILKTDSGDSDSVSKALDVDNVELDDLNIHTKVKDKKIVTRISSENMNTLLHTLDDIISCQMVAERVIDSG